MMKEFGCNFVCLFEGREIFLDVSLVLTTFIPITNLRAKLEYYFFQTASVPICSSAVHDRISLTAK